MAEFKRDPMLLVASEAELPAGHHVWGTGGWLAPEQREALDWLTLSRLLGWGVSVTHRTSLDLNTCLSGGNRWVILACDPDCLNDEQIALLASKLAAEPILVLARTGAADGAFAHLAGAARRPEPIQGRSLRWVGPGPARSWFFRKTLNANSLALSEEASIWATLEGAPLIGSRQVGRGIVTTLGFHPSHARDLDGAATLLLKHLLIWSSAAPIAWLDLEGTLVLRMDDPGSAECVHHQIYSHTKLGEAEWAAIGAELKRRHARMSIGYVSGWVDNGDTKRGNLRVADAMPRRIPGRVYPSPLVKFEASSDYATGALYDYQAEFRGIQALRAAGLVEVELHGYTHIHPDSVSWANAPDRYTAVTWYRELGRAARPTIAERLSSEHPLALGIASFRKYFKVQPTTLICSGDEWTNEVLECALNLGLHLVSSYYLALRNQDRFCWAQHVCAPYLDQPDPTWFDARLPIVGYFHDYDIALKGVKWMRKWLDRWKRAGVQKFVDFRDLAAAVSRTYSMEENGSEIRLVARGEEVLRLERPLKVMIRVKEGKMPSKVSVLHDNKDILLKVHPLDHSIGSVILPASV